MNPARVLKVEDKPIQDLNKAIRDLEKEMLRNDAKRIAARMKAQNDQATTTQEPALGELGVQDAQSLRSIARSSANARANDKNSLSEFYGKPGPVVKPLMVTNLVHTWREYLKQRRLARSGCRAQIEGRYRGAET